SDRVWIAFGYTSGPRDEMGHPEGVASVVRASLEASVPARAAALAAHLCGGAFEFVSRPDLTGIRFEVPPAAAGAVLDEAVRYLSLSQFPADLTRYARDVAAAHARQQTQDIETARRDRAV